MIQTDKENVTYRFFVSSFQLTKNAKRVFVGSVQIILWILLCFLFLWRNDERINCASYQLISPDCLHSCTRDTCLLLVWKQHNWTIGDNFYGTRNWPSFTTFKLFFRWWKFARLNLSRLVGSCWENNSNKKNAKLYYKKVKNDQIWMISY